MVYVDGPHIKEQSPLTELDDEKHGTLRTIFSHRLSERPLRAQEPLIRAHVDTLVCHMRRKAQASRSIDVVKYFNCCTFDIIRAL